MSTIATSTLMLVLVAARFVVTAATPSTSGTVLGLQRSFKLHKAAILVSKDEASAVGAHHSAKIQAESTLAIEDFEDEASAIGSTLGLQRSTKLQKVGPLVEDEDDALQHASVFGLQRSAKLVRKAKTAIYADANVDALKHGSVLGLQRSVELIKRKESSLLEDPVEMSTQPITSCMHENASKQNNSLDVKNGDHRGVGQHLRSLAISAAVLSVALGLMRSLLNIGEVSEPTK